jgi:cell wall-associated NlpC family hydrolase
MRITERATGPVRRAARPAALTASAAAAMLIMTATPTAVADRSDDRGSEVPTEQRVRDARSRAADAATQVARIQAEMAVANQRLETAAIQAEQAAEAYNGARWQVTVAEDALRRARAVARRADRQVARQRDRLAGVVAASYQDGGDVSAVNAVLDAAGPAGLMSQLLAAEGAATSMEARFQKFGATAALAEVFRDEAQRAKAEKEQLLEVAEAARDEASAAATAAQQAATSIAARKSRLVSELALLQGISRQLAERRQSALEEAERRRAAREAAAAAAPPVAEDGDARQVPDRPSNSGPPHDRRDEPTPSDPPPSTPAPPPQAPTPAPTPPPPPPAPAPSASGAARAIAFARAQLGEPYLWAAAGPDAWDCSGLTMGAWQAGGVSLPHYSAAQYDATTPISAAQLRPGDLVFWGSSGSPSSIHHVALYLGDGMIIHAPRTGRPVSIDSMYYWVPPNFFGRV